MKNIIQASQLLASILRHDKPAGVKVDLDGWARIDDVVNFTASMTPALTPEIIAQVVADNDKKRYALSEDGLLVRALQGHTRKDVQLAFEQVIPPVVLYHGTAQRFVESIRKQGLLPSGRHHVHLSPDEDTARTVGQRHDRRNAPVILVIDAKAMLAEGHKFYRSENKVWLVDTVPARFIK
jgi:putative RNA 2'-phosphotransferase